MAPLCRDMAPNDPNPIPPLPPPALLVATGVPKLKPLSLPDGFVVEVKEPVPVGGLFPPNISG